MPHPKPNSSTALLPTTESFNKTVIQTKNPGICAYSNLPQQLKKNIHRKKTDGKKTGKKTGNNPLFCTGC